MAGRVADRVGAYRRDGFVLCPEWIDQPTVHRLREELAARLAPGPIVAVPLGTSPFMDALAGGHRLAGLAASLLGAAEVRCFGCTFMAKAAGDGPEAAWHQDGHPWATGLAITSAVTLWIALDPADGTSGALRVVPGSHSLAAQPLVAAGGMFGAGMERHWVDEDRAVTLAMAPGDLSAHHPCLIHGSGPNRSSRPRRALALRYTPS